MPGSPPESMGKGRDWNVDLIPKFLMANGNSFSRITLKYLHTHTLPSYTHSLSLSPSHTHSHVHSLTHTPRSLAFLFPTHTHALTPLTVARSLTQTNTHIHTYKMAVVICTPAAARMNISVPATAAFHSPAVLVALATAMTTMKASGCGKLQSVHHINQTHTGTHRQKSSLKSVLHILRSTFHVEVTPFLEMCYAYRQPRQTFLPLTIITNWLYLSLLLKASL